MKKLILAALLCASMPAFADVDYKCVTDCANKGYQYQLCQQRCTYVPPGEQRQPQRPQQVDYQCITNCTKQGYQYPLCEQRCAY